MNKKCIVILIDGVSANYFNAHKARLPNLAYLADKGLNVRLKSDVPSVSLPARATMLSGLTFAKHGVYGNKIYDAQLGQFRYAAPDDISVPTLPALAKAAGLTVANIGFGMEKADNAHTFCPPWWLKGYIHKGREDSNDTLGENSGWTRAETAKDELGLLNGFNIDLPDEENFAHSQLAGFAAETAVLQRVAALLRADNPPDVIFTEISMTDDCQHAGGYESDLAHFAIAQADMLVGLLITALRDSGREADYAFAIAADHGHSPIDTAIYPEAFLPTDTPWSSEGSMLHVYLPHKALRLAVAGKLSTVGVQLCSNEHLPKNAQSDIAVFLAPDRMAFEPRPTDADPESQTGKAKYISSHGLRPGHPDDDRLCIFSGAGITQGVIEHADSVQFAATVAEILGVNLTEGNGKGLLLR